MNRDELTIEIGKVSSSDNEIKILRETIAKLLTVVDVSTLDLEEFNTYNASIEAITAQLDETVLVEEEVIEEEQV